MTKDRESSEAASPVPFRLLSKQEVAQLLGYTTRTIDRLVASRRIPFLYLPAAGSTGRKIKFDPYDIQRWINSGKVATPGEGDNKRDSFVLTLPDPKEKAVAKAEAKAAIQKTVHEIFYGKQ